MHLITSLVIVIVRSGGVGSDSNFSPLVLYLLQLDSGFDGVEVVLVVADVLVDVVKVSLLIRLEVLGINMPGLA